MIDKRDRGRVRTPEDIERKYDLSGMKKTLEKNLEILELLMEGSSDGSDYILPVASAKTLGGVKVGSNVNVTDTGVLTTKVIDYLSDDNLPPTSKAVNDRILSVEGKNEALTNEEIEAICK